MKAFEALAILESIDPNQEVILTIGKAVKVPTPEPAAMHTWVIGHENWIPRDPSVYPYNTITCRRVVH